MNTFRPSWLTCAISSVGNYGGLLVTWDPSKFDLDPHLCCGGVFLTGTCLWNKQSLSLLNVYGPRSNKKIFWDKVASRGLLAHKNLIAAGEFNLTLNVKEVWGDSAHQDQLAGYFNNFFQEHCLVDIVSDKLVPTW